MTGDKHADPVVLIPEWRAPAPVHAAMSTRIGGVSTAPCDTLNTGTHVGDAPTAVAENRHRLRQALQLEAEPAWLDQVHGTTVADLDAAPRTTAPIRADAAITRKPGTACVIQVADCMPVLLAASDASVIGAAHAGWRGLAGGVLEATIKAMQADPAHLHAWMGPTISQRHFEVGDEVRAAFVATDPAAAAAFERNERQRWQCDLYVLARQRLAAAGVRHIYGGNWCTYEERDRFFSFRRDGRCGRMAALIWLDMRASLFATTKANTKSQPVS